MLECLVGEGSCGGGGGSQHGAPDKGKI
jgi:hypothetical protein